MRTSRKRVKSVRKGVRRAARVKRTARSRPRKATRKANRGIIRFAEETGRTLAQVEHLVRKTVDRAKRTIG